jgi:hypothetical protein
MGMILVAIAMGSITYYYHLHEVPDEPDNEDNTSTSITVPAWPVGQAFPPANKFCTPTETTLG